MYTLRTIVKNNENHKVTLLQYVCVDCRGYMEECKLQENRRGVEEQEGEGKTSDIVHTSM